MADYVMNAFSLLQAWSSTFQQHYAPGVSDYMKRFGKTTRIIPTSKRRLLGNNIEYEVKAFHNRSTRVSRIPMANQPVHSPGDYTRFNVVWDDSDTAGTTNHFALFEVGFTTNIFNLWKRTDGKFKDSPDYIKNDVQEGLADVRETFAKYIHLDSNGVLAQIDTNYVLKQADDDRWDSASTYTDSAKGMCLVRLTASAMGRIGDGQRVDVYNATGVGGGAAGYNARHARVAYVHPYEETLVLEIVDRGTGVLDSTTQNDNSTDLANWDVLEDDVTGGDTLYIVQASSYGVAPEGTLDKLFEITTDYYGKTRDTVTENEGAMRMLQPVRVDASAGGASVPLTADWYRRVGEVVGWQQGGFLQGGPAMAEVMSKYEYRQIADFVDEAGITLTPALESKIGGALKKAFGFDGFVRHDPNLGTVLMVVDDFAAPGKIDFINRGQWEQAVPFPGGFRMFPGTIAGIWSRNNQQDDSLSARGSASTWLPGKTFSANGLLAATWVCKWPKGQVRLMGLSTS
jgi:hypothetical protein